jgi:hypothetical protein
LKGGGDAETANLIRPLLNNQTHFNASEPVDYFFLLKTFSTALSMLEIPIP